MGGYGALMLGARYPSRFKAISGHSSITKLDQMTQFVEEPLKAYQAVDQVGEVITVMRDQVDQLPALRFDCGISDPLIEANRLLHKQLLELGATHQYEEFPGGHEWPYWQEHVEKTFRFFDQHSSK